MIEDIYEPLALFRNLLRERHARKTADHFEELVARAGIDAIGNAATNATISTLKEQIDTTTSRTTNWRRLRNVVWGVAAIAASITLWQLLNLFGDDSPLPRLLQGAIALGTTIFTLQASRNRITPLLNQLHEQLNSLQQDHNDALEQAWQELAPLNRLYDWETSTNLMRRSVPRLRLDPCFTKARLDQLHHTFGWDHNFNRNKSVLFSQSGTINGNPFVVAETLDFRMGAKTYAGSLKISWRELQHYTDSQGRPRTRYVTRYQTLHAEVTKPAPEHTRQKFVIYGNEAAPTLTFSRNPSPLSQLGEGRRDKWRKERASKRLEKLSRNLDDDSGFTIMSNREFDTLFNATDRNDDLQFRLLFTPLAQEQMVALLKDRETGYGDNFSFIKDHKINFIYPEHLADIDLSAAPTLFHSHNLDDARRFFNDYNNSWFKAIYFALAPLLAIPLYQQHRSHDDIYRNNANPPPSFWEHETLANLYPGATFAHPQSVTPSILKTKHSGSNDTTIEHLAITAYGFRSEQRIDYIPRMGGDGLLHQVPVHWVEYIPVSRTTPMSVVPTEERNLQEYEDAVATSPDWHSFFARWQTTPQNAIFRRSLLAFTHPTDRSG